MSVAVYNGHLSTLGGGEQYSLAIVKWLIGRGEKVDILAPAGTSLEACEERLRVRISDGARLVALDGEFPYCEPEATARSADYDLFFNTSYASRAASRARRSVLVVYFPLPVGELPPLRGSQLEAWAVTARRQTVCVHPDTGLHHPEPEGRWTDGAASYLVGNAGKSTPDLTISLSAPRPPALPRAVAGVLLDGEEVAQRRLSRKRPAKLSFPVPPDPGFPIDNHRRVEITTDTFSPSSTGSSDDERKLGAFIHGVSVAGAPDDLDQLGYGCRLRFLDTYQQVIATSRYSATWLRRYWGVNSNVVYPPVSPPPGRPVDDRAQSIVALGRFFGGPYSKKQLELVQAFAGLCDEGLDGWTLRLVGGVNDEEYFRRVQAAAAGYPVQLEANAPGNVMEELLGEASVLWHATGWRDEPEDAPDRFEHFGIAVVEAMGAGAVPVALDIGGPTEIIRNGHDGFLWSPDAGPVPDTRKLIADVSMRAAMATRAQERAQDFSGEAFEKSLEHELSGSTHVGVSTTPLVRVVIVNYNGGELTIECLRSLRATRWPADRLEIVLVDNGSTDGVAARVQRDVPGVRVIEAGSNLGFAGGINLGLADLAGVDHVAMLNNDATVDPGWLAPLVQAVESDPWIGAASPKILFDDQFVDVEIASPADGRGLGDPRALGVRVSGARVDGLDMWRRAQPVSGFWEEEHGDGGEPLYRWTSSQACLRLPAPADGALAAGALRLAADQPKQVVVASGPERTEIHVTSEPAWHEIPLSGEPADIVNNVGSVLERGGYGANRGWLERDEGQYEHPQEVFAWCGAGVLLSRRYVESVGRFDERFFLYYEDFDLSWRGRAQGWRYLYVPASKVRHVHTASSVEGSKLFQHYVERNRLITLSRNAPAGLAATAAIRHLLVTAPYARRDVVSPMLHQRKPSPETVQRRLRAFGAYARLLPATLAERRHLRRARTVNDDELLRWMTPARPDPVNDSSGG